MTPLLIVGPPASGKSVVGRAAASLLGRSFVDLDTAVELRTGKSVSALFAEGEQVFRAAEADALASVLQPSAPVVIACGGGTLVDTVARRSCLRAAHVVALRAPLDVLATRASNDTRPRPLLRGDVHWRLSALLDVRADAYAEAHAVVDASGAPEDVARGVVGVANDLRAHPTLVVPLGQRTYRVHVAPLEQLEARVAAVQPSSVVAVHDDGAERALGARFPRVPAVATVSLAGSGDRDKTVATLSSVWDAALAADIDRDALVLAVGGGVTTDLAGFAAATLLRGVRWASAPTTLLAMVDASVGGKTGVDHARGKNLIGAFHHPAFVLVDPSAVGSQPERDVRAGLAEIVKIALACAPDFADALEAGRAISAAIPQAIQAKIDVVAADEREAGRRALLNFGHTLGHAIEAAAAFALPHGECVALGMRAAIDIGVRVGVTPAHVAERALALLNAHDMPTAIATPVDEDAVLHALGADKKRKEGAVRFVLLDGWGAASLHPVSRDVAAAALRGLMPSAKRSP